MRQVRAGVPARGHPRQGLPHRRCWRRRPRTFKSAPRAGRNSATPGTRCRWRRRTAPAVRCAWRSVPAKNKSEVKHKAINMAPQPPLREAEARNWDFFLEPARSPTDTSSVPDQVKDVQLLEPLFEFSGACAGCGETPYLKLMTSAVRRPRADRERDGCSSIYGGNLPTTPWTLNGDGTRSGVGELAVRGQRRVRPGHARWRWTQQTHLRARTAVSRLRAIARRRSRARACWTPISPTKQGSARSVSGSYDFKASWSTGGSLEARELCMRWRTRWCKKSVWIVGGDGWALRHRLRRVGSCARLGPERERAGAGHRGVLQHRRSDVKVHATRGGREVRRRRQVDAPRKTWPAWR